MDKRICTKTFTGACDQVLRPTTNDKFCSYCLRITGMNKLGEVLVSEEKAKEIFDKYPDKIRVDIE